MTKTVYLGSPLPLRRNNGGYFQTTTDPFENEKSKFINLILTKKGERVANAGFGCDLWKLLFEQKVDGVQEIAKRYVQEAVNTFMPYLELKEIKVLNEETFQHDHNISLYVRYGFAGNPLVSDEVRLLLGQQPLGELTQSGRTTSRA